jgi:hypothetical protein
VHFPYHAEVKDAIRSATKTVNMTRAMIAAATDGKEPAKRKEREGRKERRPK